MPALVIALAACAEHRPYRTSTAPLDVTGPLSDARVQAAIQSTSIERYDGYSIAVIEFDDQGRFWDRRQFAAMSAEIIRQARADEDSGVGMVGLALVVHAARS